MRKSSRRRHYYIENIRHSHVTRYHGPGSIFVNGEGVSMMICGFPSWKKSFNSDSSKTISENIEDLAIRDTYLENVLGIGRIIAPPINESQNNVPKGWLIPAIRFPLAHYCTNTNCRRISFDFDHGDSKPSSCKECKRTASASKLRQIPLFIGCKDGHIQEIDWDGLCHGANLCPSGASKLKFFPEANYLYSKVSCLSCGSSATVDKISKKQCNGHRPWHPNFSNDICNNDASIHEAPSANAYYAQTTSAIVIPPTGNLVPAIMQSLRASREIRTLRNAGWEGNAANLEAIQKILLNRGFELSLKETEHHLRALLDRQNGSDDIHQIELDAFTEARGRTNGLYGEPDLIVEPINFENVPNSNLFSLVRASALPRLRFISVLTGFSRFNPQVIDKQMGFHQLWGTEPETLFQEGQNCPEWLLGIEAFGEGLFFEFDVETLPVVSNIEKYGRVNIEINKIKKIFIHTISHLLIRVAAERSGFSLPSIRERLYLDGEKAAILLYVISPDLEGTNGGLVELAKETEFDDLLKTAIELSTWCTSDPVCLEGFEFDNGNELKGACHHCVLLPETSCELNNQFLDRAYVLARFQSLLRPS